MAKVHSKGFRDRGECPDDYETAMIKFYNRVTGENVTSICDIPTETLEFLTCMSWAELIKPLVLEHQFQGATQQQSKIKFGVSLMQVRVWTGRRRRKYLF